MKIEPELASDADAIRALHAAAFPTAGEARLVDRLRGSGRLLVSLVARDADTGRVVGHVAFSPVRAGDGGLGDAGVGVGLAPVAVHVEHRRRGVAERLVRNGLELCRQRGYGFAVVLGEPEYYRRFGFVPAARFGLVDEYGGGDAFQALELRAGAMPAGAGPVRYADEFAELDAVDADAPTQDRAR